MVVKSGYDIGASSVDELLDAQLSPAYVTNLSHLASSVPGVAPGRIRARRTGPDVLVDVSIPVAATLSASAAHQLGEHVRRAFLERHEEIKEVTVHLDPDEREELGRRGVTGRTLMDTPDVYDRKVRKVVKDLDYVGGLGRGSHGVTSVGVVYTGRGTVKVEVCLALPLECTINEGNALGRRVRYTILEHIEEVEAVDVVAELEEVRERAMTTSEGGLDRSMRVSLTPSLSPVANSVSAGGVRQATRDFQRERLQPTQPRKERVEPI